MTKQGLKTFCLTLFSVMILSGNIWAQQANLNRLPEGYLQARELSRLVYNTTAEVSFGKKNNGLIYFSPNGELKLIKQDQLHKGYWKVRKNDRLCTKLGTSSWDCRLVVKKDNKYLQYVVKKSGKHRHELTYNKFHAGKKIKQLQRSPLLPTGTLSASQVKKLFSGRTVESVTVNKGRTSLSYYNANGNLEQRRNGKIRYGKWRVTDTGRICLQMENLKEKCRIIVNKDGEYRKYIVKKSGRHSHSVTYRNFMPGKKF